MTVVIDASAMLAMIFEEQGASIVLDSSRGAMISAVNMDEVLHKCERRNIAGEKIEALLARLAISIVPFDMVQARVAARLHPALHRHGISFADRACLALAEVVGRVILTADTDWKKVGLDVDVRFIR